ncbi:MAG: porin [Janthinobacterium lividum]
MKIARLISLTALGLVPALGHAQSVVTLYGVVDEGLSYTTNSGGGRQWAMATGVLQGSRWGLRGSEDLGGGMKAIFMLENGFDISTGKAQQGGLEFGRQAYVGLADRVLGTVTLGRQYDSVVDYAGPFSDRGLGGGYIAAHPGDIDNFNNAYRANNSVKYTSPDYSGFHYGGLYSLGGVSGAITRNQVWSAGAGYKYGPAALAVAYLNARNPNVGFFGNSSTTTATATTSSVTSPVYSGFLSARTYQVIAAGGSMAFGATTVSATYSNIQFMHLGDTTYSGPNASGYTGTAHFNNGEINAVFHYTPALSFNAAYDYLKSGHVHSSTGENDGATYQQGTVGADYAFSKATDVYILGAYQHASGTDSRNKAAVASINGLTASTTNSQATIHIGLRHKF